MYDPSLPRVVLAKVARWGRLPQSDLLSVLSAEERLRFRDQVLEDLAAQGLIATRMVGDESVVSITEAGRRWLADQEHSR